MRESKSQYRHSSLKYCQNKWKNGGMGGTSGEAMKGRFDENTLYTDMKFPNIKFLFKNSGIKLFSISNVH